MKADFSKIIRDSIQITKSNKRLWVLGLVLATLGAGSGTGGGSNISNLTNQSDKTNKIEQNNSVKLDSLYNLDDLNNLNNLEYPNQNLLNTNLLTSADQLPQVLGASTNSLTSLLGLLKLIPLSFYGAFGILLIFAILLGIAVALYGQSWAQSGLIAGINRQSAGESLSLYQMSDQGKLNAVEVIKIRIFPALLFGLAVMLSALVLVIPGMLLGDGGRPLVIILGIFYGLAVIVAGIFLGASVNLGIYAINLESLKWKPAFSNGFKVFKSYFLDVAIMSVINCLAGCTFGIVGLLVLVVLGGLGFLGVMGVKENPLLLVVVSPLIFLEVLAFILIAGLLGAISIVFKQSTWVLLYKQLTEETRGTN